METDKKELSRPSLGEEMSKLLASMDPQGLLNVADQEESHSHAGVDPSKAGDAHAESHEVSLTDGGSDSGSGSEKDETGREQEKMDTNPLNFRILDMEARPDLQPIQVMQQGEADPADVGAGEKEAAVVQAAAAPIPIPVPDQHADIRMSTTEDKGKGRTAGPSFAIPAVPVGTAGGGNEKHAPLVMGKNIFQNQHENLNSNLSLDLERKMKNLKQAGFDQNLRKIPTGVQAPKPSHSLPPKKISPMSPVKPEAVPSKTYDAILLNKKKTGESGHHWWHRFRPG